MSSTENCQTSEITPLTTSSIKGHTLLSKQHQVTYQKSIRSVVTIDFLYNAQSAELKSDKKGGCV